MSRTGRLPGRGCSYGSFLAEFLRDSCKRTADTFVFAETPALQLAAMRANELNRIERFRPDILFLTCGSFELEHATGSALDFERMFFQLIDTLRRPGRVLVLNLPPAFPHLTEDEPVSTNALIRLEALRACSQEADLPVIDHWSHWESHADPSWYSSDGRSPSARGSREMARMIVRELELGTPSVSAQSPSISESPAPEVAHGTGHRQS